MKDVLIVGNGLAANVLALQCHLHHVSFSVVGDTQISNCSRVAAGIWNPIVFKRMTNSWMAETLITELLAFYKQAQILTNTSFLTERQIIRTFQEEQEVRLWQKKAEVSTSLDETIYTNTDTRLKNCFIKDKYSFVNRCGNLDVSTFIDAINMLFKTQLEFALFDFSALEILSGSVNYKNNSYKRIVFCEGHFVKYNPFFNWIPLLPAKGEVIRLSIPDVDLESLIFNRDGFLFKQDGDYTLGATYNWDELNDVPTESGKEELLEKLRGISNASFTILNHKAGVRPSSKDRRPIIGAHPQYGNVFVFNGLGTKGVMLAPYFSKNFVHFLLGKSPLHDEVSVSRFYPLFKN
jgi:glycine oxidase